MDTTALLVFAAALLLNAGSPGPSVAMLVSQVVTRGAGTVIPFVAAMWIGEAAWLAAAVTGLSVVAERFHLVFVVVKWAGLAYLLRLAVQMWRAEPEKTAAAVSRPSALGGFASGLALTIGNPKIMVFYVALLPSLVDVARLTTIGWIELTVVQILVMASVDLAWIAFAARLRGFLTSPRALRIANRTGAIAMGGAAGLVAARS